VILKSQKVWTGTQAGRAFLVAPTWSREPKMLRREGETPVLDQVIPVSSVQGVSVAHVGGTL